MNAYDSTLQIKKERPNYYILVRYKDEMTGKERQKWETTDIAVKGNNKRKAEARLKEVLAEYEQNKVDMGRSILFTVFIMQWLEQLKPSIEAVTYDTYRLIIYNQIIPFYEPKKLKLKEVAPLHIQQYVNFKLKSVSPNTVRKHLWNLSKCFNSAIKQKLIVFNPVKGIDMPKKIKYTGAKFYNEKQIDELPSVVKDDILEGIILLSVFYGLRRSEVIGLKWSAINFENKTFDIKHTVVRVDKVIHKKDSAKNDSSYRTLPMPEIIIEMLHRVKAKQEYYRQLQPNDYADEDYVFTWENGQLILPNYVTKHFKNLFIEKYRGQNRGHSIREQKNRIKIFRKP
jgi:integrase